MVKSTYSADNCWCPCRNSIDSDIEIDITRQGPFFLGEKMLAPHPATLLWRAKVHLYWALAGFGRTAKKNIPY